MLFEVKFGNYLSFVCCWRKKNTKFNMVLFANLIANNSKTQVVIIKKEKISNFFKKTLKR